MYNLKVLILDHVVFAVINGVISGDCKAYIIQE
jgi:hypothetical protein